MKIMNHQNGAPVWNLYQVSLVGVAFIAVGTALAQNYAIDWFRVAGGGGTSTGGVYKISGTLGQPEAGTLKGGSYSLQGGFWAVLQTPGAPRLALERVANGVQLSWPVTVGGFVLEQTGTLGGPAPAPWTAVDSPYQTNANQISVTLPVQPGNKYFRLRKQP